MSEYFNVLNRLRNEQTVPSLVPLPRPAKTPGVTAGDGRSRSAKSPAVVQLRRPPVLPAIQPAAPAPSLEPLVDLVDQNRVSGGRRCLVLSAASPGGVAEALVAQAVGFMRDRGMPVDAVRIGAADTSHASADNGVAPLPLDMNQADWALRLQAWSAALPANHVVFVVAPPLAASPDAARVARACDGLIILVEIGRTTRAELKLAVKRARTAGCAILGQIVVGADPLPKWARQLLQS